MANESKQLENYSLNSLIKAIDVINDLENKVETLEKRLKVIEGKETTTKKLLTIDEAQNLLGYRNRVSFLKAVRQNNIPCIHISSKIIKFNEDELNNYIEKNYSTYKHDALLQKRDAFLSKKRA